MAKTLEVGQCWSLIQNDGHVITGIDVTILRLETAHVLVELLAVPCPYGGLERRWVGRALFVDPDEEFEGAFSGAYVTL